MANTIKATPQKKGRFLAELRKTGNITHAVTVIGIDRRHIYRIREGDAEFAAAWDDAIQAYADKLEAAADQRAVDGYVKQVVLLDDGDPIEIRAYSDVLLMFRLKALRPEQYKERGAYEHTGAGGGPLQVELQTYAEDSDSV